MISSQYVKIMNIRAWINNYIRIFPSMKCYSILHIGIKPNEFPQPYILINIFKIMSNNWASTSDIQYNYTLHSLLQHVLYKTVHRWSSAKDTRIHSKMQQNFPA